MKKLKLPVIKDEMLEPPVLSMDEYVKFIEFHLTCGFDQSGYEEEKKSAVVNVVFRLKPSKFKKA